MNKDNDTKSLLVFASLGIIPLIWTALLIAPSMEDGIFQALAGFGESLEKPFEIIIVKDSLRTVLLFLLIYWMGIGIYLSTRKNYRRGEEHGSAKWADEKEIHALACKEKPYQIALRDENGRYLYDDKGDFVSFEDAVKMCGVDINAIQS